MTFGRPFMIGESYNTKIPTMIDDEFLQEVGIGTQPPNVPSQMGLFVSSCKLFEILTDILSTFYVGKDDSSWKQDKCTQEMIAGALSFNRRLDEFASSIPDYLKTPDGARPELTGREGYINLQQQVLYCR